MTNLSEKVSVATPGSLFVEAINHLLAQQRKKDNNRLWLNPETIGPIFDVTIERLRQEGADMHAESVFLATLTRLHDDLEANKAKYKYPDAYYLVAGVRQNLIGDVCLYFSQNPDAEEQFHQIEASY